MPKHANDIEARNTAESFVSANDADAATIVKAFPFVEFERESKTVQGESVTLQRLVLTGPWMVAE